jgi:hypothetical protein
MNIYVLIDRSGSMASLWSEAIGSVNAYASKVADARKYVAVFDNTSYDVLRDLNADKWVDIQTNEAHPRGMTPLYDATGKILDKVFSDKPEKAVIVIMTDGEENCSTEYSQTAIKARLADAEKLGWQVVFLGANFDKVAQESAKVGVRTNRSVNMTKGLLGSGMEMLAEKTMVYAATQDVSAYASTMDFTEEEMNRLSGKIVEVQTPNTSVKLTEDGTITVKKRSKSKKKPTP